MRKRTEKCKASQKRYYEKHREEIILAQSIRQGGVQPPSLAMLRKTSAAQLARNKRWRQNNLEQMREIRGNYYHRNREWICWKAKLSYLLEKVRLGVIARGGVPYDG